MIIQANEANAADFPRRFDQIALLLGLLIFAGGQVLLRQGPAFVSAQAPIDFAHWMLLVGALFFLPFAGRLPRRNIHLITLPLLIAGVAAVVGMCVLDFIFWSLPPGELRDQTVAHLTSTDVIWTPFITFGPNYIFVTGLALPSASYWSVSKAGVLLVIVPALSMAFFGQWVLVPAYLTMALGYALCFGMLRLPGTKSAQPSLR